ncbi:MAG: helix-turn-helix domain-containing protein [Flammeovirgaceae bacterium]
MTIGEKIKELVDRSGERTETVAKRLGMSVQNLYKIYKKKSCESKYLETLMAAFDVDSSYFFENRDLPSDRKLTMAEEEMPDYITIKDKYLELMEKHIKLLEECNGGKNHEQE